MPVVKSLASLCLITNFKRVGEHDLRSTSLKKLKRIMSIENKVFDKESNANRATSNALV